MTPTLLGILLLAAQAVASDHTPKPTPRAWVAAPQSNPGRAGQPVLVRADAHKKALLLVGCDSGVAIAAVNDQFDPESSRTMLHVRFDSDAEAWELAVRFLTERDLAYVEDPGFADLLVRHETESLQVEATLADGDRTLPFALDGLSAARAACRAKRADAVAVTAVAPGDPSTTTEVHHSEVRIKRKVEIVLPADAAAVLGTEPVRCRTRVYLDATGAPERIEMEDCPHAFEEAVRDALMAWSWYPPTIDGVPARVNFVLMLSLAP